MALAFSTNEQAAFSKSVNTVETHVRDLGECFEITRCVQWIQENQHKSVALQFPDALIKYCPQVSQKIEESLGQK